ncbi:DUF167 domain-containing protein [Candidatus Falkowbacteria bacterium]|nr:DUF167 domain-containing protein [Candidatus Falkowbacteria bacterium]
MLIVVKVIPRSSKNELEQISRDVFKAKITVAPKKGKANAKIIELLSKYFDLPKSEIQIVSGLTSKQKRVLISD